jgi:hypothetical protein
MAAFFGLLHRSTRRRCFRDWASVVVDGATVAKAVAYEQHMPQYPGVSSWEAAVGKVQLGRGSSVGDVRPAHSPQQRLYQASARAGVLVRGWACGQRPDLQRCLRASWASVVVVVDGFMILGGFRGWSA